MQGRHQAPPGSSAARLRRWLERSFVLAGLAGLVWSAALVADAVVAQRSARRSLQAVIPEAPRLAVPAGVSATEPLVDLDAPARSLAVTAGSAIAELSIPRIGLSAAVLHGSDAQTLRRGPGHLENTAYPGEAGNVVIAGHRDSFFLPLRHIRVGDDIYLAGAKGRFHYRVSSLRVVNPREVAILAPTDEATLTLITCYPFWIFGHAPDRFVVRAIRVAAPPAVSLEARTSSLPEGDESPPTEMVAAKEPAAISAPGGADDESRVRRALARYLSMQGLRLAPHGDAASAGTRLVRCEVVSGEGRAIAHCDPAADSPSDPPQPGRTLMLERSKDTWAIRSIVLR